MRSVVDRNFVSLRMTVHCEILLSLIDRTDNNNGGVMKFIWMWYNRKDCTLSQMAWPVVSMGMPQIM